MKRKNVISSYILIFLEDFPASNIKEKMKVD